MFKTGFCAFNSRIAALALRLRRQAGLPEEEREWQEEPDRELLARLSAAAFEFNSAAAGEIPGELERRRYERGQEFTEWLREQAENFNCDVIHKELEEFLGAPRSHGP